MDVLSPSDVAPVWAPRDAPESTGQALPLEEGAILVVSRAKPKHYDEMVQFLRAYRSDVRVLYLSSRVVSEARRLLVSYRVRLDEARLGPFYGGSTPSTGYLGKVGLFKIVCFLTHPLQSNLLLGSEVTSFTS